MADNKRKRGEADRARVAAGEGYEVSLLRPQTRHLCRADQALIKKVGNNRDRLNKAAEKVSRR